MSATLSIAALLTLKDQFSAPLRQVQGALGALNERLRTVQSTAQRVSSALRGVSDAASRLSTAGAQIAAVGQITTGFGLESYLRDAVSVEHRLAALGNTANMSAGDLKMLNERLSAASRATNQFKADLLTGNEQLIAAGLEWQKALDITPVLGKVATATQASMGDLAQTAYALTSNLKVPVEQMQQAFERLTVAGQSGQFELKDMAREFAKLGASMGALKFTGVENVSRLGAALQIARRGAGDASEAANNLQNFLAKLAAPEVQKNFEKFGIDLPRLLKTARERGLDPFLVTLKAIQKATGGDEFKLGELFGDMQVQNFIKPMLLYADDYKRLVQEINAANGVIEGNFGRMMNTTAERWRQFRIQLETTPMPWLDELIGMLSALLEKMNAYPKIASGIAAGLAGIAAAAGALKGASWLFSGLSGLIGLGGAAGKVGQAAKTLGARIRAIVAGGWMRLTLAWQTLTAWGGRLMTIAGSVGSAIATAAGVAGRAILWLGRAVLTTPIGVALTAIAGAAYLVWQNWETIGPKLAAVWETVKGAFASAWQWLQSAGTAAADALRWAFLNMTPVGQVIQHWDTIKAGAIALIDGLRALPAQMMQIGRDLLDGLVAGLGERWAAVKESITGLGAGIRDWFADTLGIRSPSRVFAELGGHLMGGLQLGIERAAGLPMAAMRGVAAGLAAPLAAGGIMMGAGAAGATQLAAGGPAIQITIHLNGPATPEAAQDVALAVRREVERALAEAGRRDALARRAALIDGGLA